jgi:hypothetical protein
VLFPGFPLANADPAGDELCIIGPLKNTFQNSTGACSGKREGVSPSRFSLREVINIINLVARLEGRSVMVEF